MAIGNDLLIHRSRDPPSPQEKVGLVAVSRRKRNLRNRIFASFQTVQGRSRLAPPQVALMPRGQFLLPTAAKGIKNAARGLGVLLTPPFVWFRDHILTIVSKFGGDGGVSFLVCFLPIMLVSKGYACFGTHHVYTGSHFGLQRGDCRARLCKSLDVAIFGVTNEEIPMLRIALRVRLRAAPSAQDDMGVDASSTANAVPLPPPGKV